MRRPQVLATVEGATALDGPDRVLRRAVLGATRPRRIRDALSGVWLGHPLHPVLVQVPVGAWISAAVLDLLPGGRRPATVLIATGVAAAVPAVAAGATDWSAQGTGQRRVGLVHAAANSTALGLYLGSLAARAAGRYRLGRALAFLGLGVAGGGAYLGGHLTYSRAAGVNQAAPQVLHAPEQWERTATLVELPEGKPVARRAGDVPVLLYRQGDHVTALVETCGHHGGPLGDGETVDHNGEACVVCPWHGSTFRLRDGRVVHGPAGSDQPMLASRVIDGRVEVRVP